MSANKAVTMIANCEGQRVACNVDWLSFSVKSREVNPTIECPEGYRMEVLQGNNVFKERFILKDLSGVKLITVLWHPFSRVLDQRLMTVQVANSQLYADGGVMRCYDLLQECVECSFNACSRIDICLDFVADDRKAKIIRKLSEGGMYVEKKREGSVWWHESTIGSGEGERKVKQCHCLSWGAKDSEVKVKLYWKSREVGLVGAGDEKNISKPYIVDEWKANGMDVKRVWRLEFSLSGAGKLLWDSKVIQLDDVASPFWFCRVFAGLYRTRFVVRKNQGRRTKKHNADEIVPFLNLPFDRLPIAWRRYQKREPLTPDGEVLKTIRHLIMQCDSEVVRCNPEFVERLYDLCDTMCQKSHAYPYVNQLLGKPLYDYFSDIYTEAGEGKHEVLPSLAKSLA